MSSTQTIAPVSSKEAVKLFLYYSEWYFRDEHGAMAGVGHGVHIPITDTVSLIVLIFNREKEASRTNQMAEAATLLKVSKGYCRFH